MVLLNSLILTLLGFLPFPDSEVYSDFTARGGETQVKVTVDKTGARLDGRLLGVIGENGKRVGFVGVRTPIALDYSSTFFIKVEGVNSLKVRAVFSTSTRGLPRINGELSYQCLLVPTGLENVYKIEVKDLVPTVRGRSLPVSQAPAFKNTEVTELALELKLSEQVFDEAEGVDFNFKVFWNEIE